jgi:hypothetical protein
MPKMISVIESSVLRGNGKDDPLRGVRQYHTPDGEFLAEYDPSQEDAANVQSLIRGYEILAETLKMADAIQRMERLDLAREVVKQVLNRLSITEAATSGASK